MMLFAAFLIRPKLRKTGKFKSLFLIGQQVFGAALTAVKSCQLYTVQFLNAKNIFLMNNFF